MMLPAVTVCPPNSFTPRRRPAESRPLRELPPAFFCAIASVSSAADGDVSDADTRQILTVPQSAAVVLAALLLEDGDLLAASLLDNLGAHDGAGHGRRADGHTIVAAHQQHLFKLQAGPSLSGQALYLEHLVLGDPILLAAGFDHCVHLFACVARGKTSPGERRPVARAGTIPSDPEVSTALTVENTVNALGARQQLAIRRLRVERHVAIGKRAAGALDAADSIKSPRTDSIKKGRVHADGGHAATRLAVVPHRETTGHIQQRQGHAPVPDLVLIQEVGAHLQPSRRPAIREADDLVADDILERSRVGEGAGFVPRNSSFCIGALWHHLLPRLSACRFLEWLRAGSQWLCRRPPCPRRPACRHR